MATIDYKQKIKDYMNSSEVDTLYKSMLNNLFPELKESKSKRSDVIKCLINGMRFYYEDNKEATWGTDKWSMPVKDIIEVLEKQEEHIKSVWHDVKEKPIYNNSEIQLAVYGITTKGDTMSVCSLIDKNTIYVPYNNKEYKWGTCPFTKWAYVTDLLNFSNASNFEKNRK